MSKKEQRGTEEEGPDSAPVEVDMEALDRITKRVLAFRPSQHRKKKKSKQAKQEKPKPPSK